MLRNIVGRNDDLSVAYLVIRNEDKLEVLAGVRVSINHVADSNGEGDNALGNKIAGGSLASNEAGPGLDLGSILGAHPLDFRVAMDDLEDIQQLTLVLVDPLDLNTSKISDIC